MIGSDDCVHGTGFRYDYDTIIGMIAMQTSV